MLTTYQYKHLLVFILMAFSGNPIVTHVLGKYAPLVGLLLTVVILLKKNIINRSFKKTLLWMIGGIAFISLLQYIEFKFVSAQGIANLCAKVVFGGLIVHYLRDEFAKTYFNVLSFLSAISILFFITVALLKIPIPSIKIGDQFHSFLLYTNSSSGTSTQNAGMFWEPGAFAGIITLGLILNFNRFGYLLKQERFKFICVVLALLTTQSTTGYLVGFIIAIFYLLINKNILVSLFLVPAVIFLGIFVYQNTDFLESKIEHQFEKSSDQSVGEFSNTRFGSIIFDWHYIKKHPIIGNGLHKETRYADHQFLFSNLEEDVVGSGNAFSHYLASMGIIFIGGYFFFLWKSTQVSGIRYSILFILIIFLNLQGEQWLNFPLYLGLPFLIVAEQLKPVIPYKRIIPSTKS